MISEKHDFTVLGGLRHNKLVIFFFKEEKDNIPVVELGKMFTIFKNSPLPIKYTLQINFQLGLAPNKSQSLQGIRVFNSWFLLL